MIKRITLIGGTIIFFTIITSICFSSQGNMLENALRKRITDRQEKAKEIAAALQRKDRITTIVISGDTVRTTSLLAQSRNADLLIADAMNKKIVEIMEKINRELGNTVQAKLLFDIRDYHMDVSDVGVLAHEAKVKRLALTHLAPQPQSNLQARVFFKDPVEKNYSGELYVGEDGMQIVISLK